MGNKIVANTVDGVFAPLFDFTYQSSLFTFVTPQSFESNGPAGFHYIRICTLFSIATFGGSLLFEVSYFEAMLGNFALWHSLSLRKEKRLSRGLRVGDLL